MNITRTDLEAVEILNAKRQKALLSIPMIAESLYLASKGILREAVPLDIVFQRSRIRVDSDAQAAKECASSIIPIWENPKDTPETKSQKIANALADIKLAPTFTESQYNKVDAWFSMVMKSCVQIQAMGIADNKTIKNILMKANRFDEFMFLLEEESMLPGEFLETIKPALKTLYQSFEKNCSMVEEEPGKSFTLLVQARKANYNYAQAIKNLVDKSTPLVKKISTSLNNTNSYADERIAVGMAVIPKQIETFDPRKNYEFSTWVYPRIKGEMLNFLNRDLNQFNVPEKIRLSSVAYAQKNQGDGPDHTEHFSPFSTSSIHEPVADGMEKGDFLGNYDDPLANLVSLVEEQEINNLDEAIQQRKVNTAKFMLLKMRFGLEGHEQCDIPEISMRLAISPLEAIFLEASALYETSSVISCEQTHAVDQVITEAKESVQRFIKEEIKKNASYIPWLTFENHKFINAMSITNPSPEQAKLSGHPVITLNPAKDTILIFNADPTVVEQLSMALEATGHFSEARTMPGGGASIKYSGSLKNPKIEDFLCQMCEESIPEVISHESENSNQLSLF